MNSAKAHGFLIAGLINDHLFARLDQEDVDYYNLPEATAFCPRCCGPCAALKKYFFTKRGRAEADIYVKALGKSGGYDWQLPDGGINWLIVAEKMKLGWCPNHDDALHQRGKAREKFHD